MRFTPWKLWLVVAALLIGLVGDLRAEDDPSPLPEAQVLDLLGKARALRQQLDLLKDEAVKAPLQDQFEETLRALAPALVKVPVDTSGTPGRFTKLTLNARGRGFDAIRFTTPQAQTPWDMHWEFVVPAGDGKGNMTSWYIVAREGHVNGFKNFEYERNQAVEGIDAPKENFHVTQSLQDGVLKPGGEYLIWFLWSEEPVKTPAYVRIALVPEGNPKPGR